MSEEATAAAPAATTDGGAQTAAPSSAPAVIGGQNPGTTPAATQSTPDATPPTTQTPAADTGVMNPYEEYFSPYFNADGTAKDGWTEHLSPDIGIDAGRQAKLGRQTSFNGLIKSLSHAQDALEKRDGIGTFVPDRENENAFNEYRSNHDIPIDPLDPEQGYKLSAVGEDDGLAKIIAPLLHEANVPRGVATQIAEQYGEFMAQSMQAQQDQLTQAQEAREQAVYDEFKKEWGFEFDQKNQAVGNMHQTYELDFDDPHDRAAITNPKVIRMMADLAAFSRSTVPTPESQGDGQNHALSPTQQAQEIMKANPQWRDNPQTRDQVNALFKQAARLKGKR